MTKRRDPGVRALRRAGGLHRQIDDILSEHGGRRAASSRSYANRHSQERPVVSFRTQAERKRILHRAFDEIRGLGYKIENARNIAERHVRAYIQHLEALGRSPGTLQGYLSVIKVFAEEMLGKTGMLKPIEAYLNDPARGKRVYAAQRDKSWTGNGINIPAKLAEIRAKDTRGAAIVGLIWAFGLRMEEALMVRLRQAVTDDGYLQLEFTKGGRPRRVRVDSDLKRAAIQTAMSFVGQRGHLGWPRRTLKQSRNRLDYLVRQVAKINKRELNTTLHGLRHQYVCDSLERHGVVAPVRGGDNRKVPKEQCDAARQDVTEETGHARKSITNAYAGKFPSATKAAQSANDETSPTATPSTQTPPTAQVAAPDGTASNDSPAPGLGNSAA